MGNLNEFSLPVKLFLKAYPWRRIEPVPWAPPKKPMAECRLALVSTAAFVLPGQKPFDESIRGDDFSFREIPGDAAVAQLIESHPSESFDHKPSSSTVACRNFAQSINAVFPSGLAQTIETLRSACGYRDRKELTGVGHNVRDRAPADSG